MNVLFLSGWFPYPPDNGSKLRISNLLQALTCKHEVTLLSFADQQTDNVDVAAARRICREVQVVPSKVYNPHSRRARIGLLGLTPRSVAATYSPAMKQQVQHVLSARKYDLVIASQLSTACYAPAFQNRPALFEELEVGVLCDPTGRAVSPAQKLRYGLTWSKHRQYLSRLLPYFSACTVVSDRERDLLRERARLDPPLIEVIPNCIQLTDYWPIQKQIRPDTLIFTGSFRYHANHDAMDWFLQEIYPRVRAKVPGVRLTITGDHANVPLPSADDVTLTGVVDDVRPLVSSSSVSLAPMRIGGGTRLKILEAMALRTPIVATSKGAEGLDVQHGQHLLIADTPEAFAQGVVRVLKEPGLRQRLTDKAYQLVRDKYDSGVVIPLFMNLVDRVAQN